MAARPFRQWSDVRAEIRMHLRETDATKSFWTDDLILSTWNRAKSLREMQLHQASEGYGTDIQYRDLTASQPYYALPTGTGHVSRVLIVRTDGREIPCNRNEMYAEPNLIGTSTQDDYFPEYRIIGNVIVLSPAPSTTVTAGLKIEVSTFSADFANDADSLEVDYPAVMEDLLIYDTIIGCLDHSGAWGPSPQGVNTSYVQTRGRFESVFLDYIEEKSSGIVLSVPFSQGG